MTIKVWNYIREYQNEKDEIFIAIKQVLDSGTLILGKNVSKFEKEFSSYCNVQFGIGVGNGTDALFLSLKALNIGPGDEVITVPNTAVPTVSAIVSTGATVKFVDVEPKTYLMDTAKIKEAITDKTKCIVPVHLFGQCVDMDKISETAKKHGLYIVEDCAQSHGAKFRSKKAGSMSDMAAFSFYPTKVLGCFGDGGMVITGDKSLYEKVKRLRFYGMEETYYSKEHGYNSRLDELQAAILLNKLSRIDEYITKRRNLAIQYDKLLAKTGLILPETMEGNKHVFYLYVVRHHHRDKIISKLKKKGIIVNISYPWPVHLMPAYRFLGYGEGDFPVAEKAAQEIFSLPMYPSLTNEEQKIVVKALLEILSTEINKPIMRIT
ncbi:MAG: DegT/DnrJ/EryC1/StrS family aminotransferase [Deltaproteobacteria bacterium]|nr:DegT/DnrJ/EryC1/StrS family aminotransferase [Deltaproteobacteria bacterium]